MTARRLRLVRDAGWIAVGAGTLSVVGLAIAKNGDRSARFPKYMVSTGVLGAGLTTAIVAGSMLRRRCMDDAVFSDRFHRRARFGGASTMAFGGLMVVAGFAYAMRNPINDGGDDQHPGWGAYFAVSGALLAAGGIVFAIGSRQRNDRGGALTAALSPTSAWLELKW